MAKSKDREEYEAELTIKLRSIGFSLERTLFGSWVAFHPLGDKVKLKNLAAVEALYLQQTSSGRGFKKGARVKPETPTPERITSPWQREGDASCCALTERLQDKPVFSLNLRFQVETVDLSDAPQGAEKLAADRISQPMRFTRERFQFVHQPPLPVTQGALLLLLGAPGATYLSVPVRLESQGNETRFSPILDADHRRLAERLDGNAELDYLLVGADRGVVWRLRWNCGPGFHELRQTLSVGTE